MLCIPLCRCSGDLEWLRCPNCGNSVCTAVLTAFAVLTGGRVLTLLPLPCNIHLCVQRTELLLKPSPVACRAAFCTEQPARCAPITGGLPILHSQQLPATHRLAGLQQPATTVPSFPCGAVWVPCAECVCPLECDDNAIGHLLISTTICGMCMYAACRN